MVGKSRRRGGKSKKGVSQKEGFKIPKEPSEELLDNEVSRVSEYYIYMLGGTLSVCWRSREKGVYPKATVLPHFLSPLQVSFS